MWGVSKGYMDTTCGAQHPEESDDHRCVQGLGLCVCWGTGKAERGWGAVLYSPCVKRRGKRACQRPRRGTVDVTSVCEEGGGERRGAGKGGGLEEPRGAASAYEEKGMGREDKEERRGCVLEQLDQWLDCTTAPAISPENLPRSEKLSGVHRVFPAGSRAGWILSV